MQLTWHKLIENVVFRRSISSFEKKKEKHTHTHTEIQNLYDFLEAWRINTLIVEIDKSFKDFETKKTLKNSAVKRNWLFQCVCVQKLKQVM